MTGALTGGLYGLFALGLTLTWGVLHLINLAHFSFAFLAAYITYQLAVSWALDPLSTIVLSAPLFFLRPGHRLSALSTATPLGLSAVVDMYIRRVHYIRNAI